MPISELKKLLYKLSQEGVADIPLDDLIKSLPIGKVCEFGKGKLCKGIRLWVDTNGMRNFWLEGFMPKGTHYDLNKHPDAREILTVVDGVLENTNLSQTRQPGEVIIWRANTPHNLLALTDLTFYSHLIEEKNEK